jgi:hypothetical protein
MSLHSFNHLSRPHPEGSAAHLLHSGSANQR